jgi:hypothetical protein
MSRGAPSTELAIGGLRLCLVPPSGARDARARAHALTHSCTRWLPALLGPQGRRTPARCCQKRAARASTRRATASCTPRRWRHQTSTPSSLASALASSKRVHQRVKSVASHGPLARAGGQGGRTAGGRDSTSQDCFRPVACCLCFSRALILSVSSGRCPCQHE